jgi:hypothetical protein
VFEHMEESCVYDCSYVMLWRTDFKLKAVLRSVPRGK